MSKHTEREGEKENRLSFEQSKNKEKSEEMVDKNKEKIAAKKEEKSEKRLLREHK